MPLFAVRNSVRTLRIQKSAHRDAVKISDYQVLTKKV